MMVESVELVGDGRLGAGLVNITAAVAIGLTAAVTGLAIGRALAI